MGTPHRLLDAQLIIVLFLSVFYWATGGWPGLVFTWVMYAGCWAAIMWVKDDPPEWLRSGYKSEN